jgi:hypothetical protein
MPLIQLMEGFIPQLGHYKHLKTGKMAITSPCHGEDIGIESRIAAYGMRICCKWLSSDLALVDGCRFESGLSA